MSWRKFGANSSFLTIASIAVAGLQLAIFMFVARLEGPLLLGQYALAQAYAMPAYFLASLSLRPQYLVLQPSSGLFSDFLFLRLLVPALVFAFLLMFIYFHDSPSFFLIVAGVCAMKYVEGLFDLAYGKMQREGDVIGVATTNLTRCLISIPAFGAIYLTTRNLPLALFFLSALWIGLFIIQRKRLDINARLSAVLDFRADHFKRRVGIAQSLFPFSVSLILTSLGGSAPRFLLDAVLGPKELGFFSAVCHFLMIGAIAANSIGQVLLPSLAGAIGKHSSHAFWRRLLWPVALVQCASIVAVFIAMAVGPELLTLFYGAEFASHGRTLVVATVAAGPLYCAGMFLTGCYAAQMRRWLIGIQCVSLLVVIAATLILVPCFGIDGAFGAMMISAATQMGLSIAFLLRFFRVRQPSFTQDEDRRTHVARSRDGRPRRDTQNDAKGR
jgi:O-antigen/teichoic acid export membrane protein